MSVKIVLQNTVAQLETQKTKAYDEAKMLMLAQTKPILDEYRKTEQAKYEEAVTALKTALDNAIAEKQSEVEAQAKVYAETKVAKIDNSIAELKKLIETAED